jgi:hypothetical protein
MHLLGAMHFRLLIHRLFTMELVAGRITQPIVFIANADRPTPRAGYGELTRTPLRRKSEEAEPLTQSNALKQPIAPVRSLIATLNRLDKLRS